MRQRTADQDAEAGEGARDEAERLRIQSDDVQSKLEAARDKLNELVDQVHEARTAHARAVKDKQVAVAQLQQQYVMNDYRNGYQRGLAGYR